MGVKVENLTDRDIRHYKRDIENYKARQKLFLTLGFVFLGVFLVLIAGSVVFGIFSFSKESFDVGMFSLMYVCMTFAVVFMVAFIAMFILRNALFMRKIENRNRLIEDYEELHGGEVVENK